MCVAKNKLIALISLNYPKDTLYWISQERPQVNAIGPYIAPSHASKMTISVQKKYGRFPI